MLRIPVQHKIAGDKNVQAIIVHVAGRPSPIADCERAIVSRAFSQSE
jgi:hypothetical protein